MGYGPGLLGGFTHVIGALMGALFGFFIFLVVIGLVFLLVRFLLVATKAAHIYVAKNSPPPAPRPAATVAPTGPAAPTTVRPSTTTPRATTTSTAAKPPAKPRTPKPPTE
ncbi:hypothetical protein BH11ACT4_BH11ACT4_02850 [soil metagenome]